jgi:protoporphyrinogen oxidase
MTELLQEEDLKFFERVNYQGATVVHVRTDRPLDGRCYSVSIPRVEKMAASTITFHDFIDPAAVNAGEGLLSISGGGAEATPERLLADLRRIYRVTPKSAQSVEWPSAMPKFPPGRFREIEAFRSRRRPGLAFCGDYLQGPFLEAAVTTGIVAAEDVLKRG